MPRIRDVEDYFSSEKILVSRDRIQIILNHCHDAVSIVSRKTNLDYDVMHLSSVIPQQKKQNPSSDNTRNTVVTEEPKRSQSSTVIVLLDNIDQKKSSKQLTKPIISNPIPLEPAITTVASESQAQSVTMKQGTPLAGRLHKRKRMVSSRRNAEDNPKPASSDNSECTS